MTTLFIGLDAGGTKTELLAARGDEGRPLRLQGGAANLQREGAAATAAVLAGLIARAAERLAPFHVLRVCAGVAGADDPADRLGLAEAVHQALRQRGVLAGERTGTVCVVQDGVVALEAALGGDSGVVLVLGTGSVWLARTHAGAFVRVGGWGYLLGDEGSGHALGLAGLRLLAAVLDGGPDGMVPARIRETFAITGKADLVRRVYREGWPVQEVAPLVLDAAAQGDEAANRILDEAAAALLKQFTILMARVGAEVTPHLVLMGGLARAPVYRAKIEETLRKPYPQWQLRKPVDARPVTGALRLVRRLASLPPSFQERSCHGPSFH